MPAHPHLHTDVSDYGIDGQFSQKKSDKKLPIRFINESLQKSQLNWSTIDRGGAFAIFYAITSSICRSRQRSRLCRLEFRWASLHTHERANKERIMSAKVHATIGVSPAELLSGQSIKLYSLIAASFAESLTKGIEAATVGQTTQQDWSKPNTISSR